MWHVEINSRNNDTETASVRMTVILTQCDATIPVVNDPLDDCNQMTWWMSSINETKPHT